MINREWTPASENLLKSLEARQDSLSPGSLELFKALSRRKQTFYPHADQGALFGGEGIKVGEPHHYEGGEGHKHRVAGAAPVHVPSAATPPVPHATVEKKSEKTSSTPLRDAVESRNNIEAPKFEATKEKTMKITSKTEKGTEFTLEHEGGRLYLSVPAMKFTREPASRGKIRGVDSIECSKKKVAIPVTPELEPVLSAQSEHHDQKALARKAEAAKKDADVRANNDIIFALTGTSESFKFHYDLVEGYVNKSGHFVPIAGHGTIPQEIGNQFSDESARVGNNSHYFFQVTPDEIAKMSDLSGKHVQREAGEAAAREAAIRAKDDEKKAQSKAAFEAVKAEAAKTNQDVAWGKPYAGGEGPGEEGVILVQHYVRPDGTTYKKEHATY